MEEQKRVGKQPDFKGSGCAAWINKTREGKDYISLDLFDGKVKGIKLWKNEPKSRILYDNEPANPKGFYPKKY